MHRLIQDHLEEVLAEPDGEGFSPAAAHLAECRECREEVSALREQAALFGTLRAAATDDTLAPRPGFYARVMERIEAQRPIDIWQIFFDSAFGRRIAVASTALVLLFSLYLISSERFAQPITVTMEEHSSMTHPEVGLPDKDTVLVDLVTYREQ
jgi:predicted anti-sigma-YlaC factor YlaD